MKKELLVFAVAFGIGYYSQQRSNTASIGSAKKKRLIDLVNTGEPLCFAQLLDINNIDVNPSLFQNRDTDFSHDSVNKIVTAVENNTFNWAAFDAITVWFDERKQKYFVLSGHSRKAAFAELTAKGLQGFDKIPAKVFEGTQAQAVNFALNSNTLATPEKETERSNYYKRLIQNGDNPRAVAKECALREAANASRIWAYVYLNRQGKTFTALKAFETGDVTSGENIRAVAKWIGDIRNTNYELSDLHEDEIYTYLIRGKFGTKYRRYNDFKEDIERLIVKRKAANDFASDKPLNLNSLEHLTPVVDTWKTEVKAKTALLADLCVMEIAEAKKLMDTGASRAEYNRKMLDVQGAKANIEYELMKARRKKDDVLNYAAKNEQSLF